MNDLTGFVMIGDKEAAYVLEKGDEFTYSLKNEIDKGYRSADGSITIDSDVLRVTVKVEAFKKLTPSNYSTKVWS